MIGRSSAIWQREYFDHLIRSPDALERAIEYVWNNPDMAALKNWKWRWKFGVEKVGAVNAGEAISYHPL